MNVHVTNAKIRHRLSNFKAILSTFDFFQILVDQISVLETLTCHDFDDFRYCKLIFNIVAASF